MSTKNMILKDKEKDNTNIVRSIGSVRIFTK